MKKFLNVIGVVILLEIIFMISSNAMQLEMNSKEKNKEYKNRNFNIEGLTFTFHDEIFYNGNNEQISLEQQAINNKMIFIFCILWVIYWITLLLLYEREENCNFTYENIDDIQTLKKYNPLIAGCLVDNRQVLARDVTAVIMNLIQKQAINMKMVPNLKKGNDYYEYIISENHEKQGNLDAIESYVLNMLFGFYEKEEVNFVEKLKELSSRKDFIKHMRHLDKLSQKELYKIGANIPKVPKTLRKVNIVLLMFSILLSIMHIINNGINVYIYQSTIWLFLLITFAVILVLPLVAVLIHLILVFIVIIKKLLKSTVERYSGKKIVQTSAFILLTMLILIGLVYLVVPNQYICLDLFLIGMSILIVKTDHLMTKHNPEILNDYYALNEIKYRIKEYSLIKDEQINYIKIWDEYLIYAVAFGIPIPIVNKLKETSQEDEDLKYLAKCENLYYICKAYLEIMWDMKFKQKKQIFQLTNLFDFESPTNETNKMKF